MAFRKVKKNNNGFPYLISINWVDTPQEQIDNIVQQCTNMFGPVNGKWVVQITGIRFQTEAQCTWFTLTCGDLFVDKQ